MGSVSKTVELNRIYMGPEGTHGRITVDGRFVAYSVELPWKGNERDVSCIPAGSYDLAYVESPHFGQRLHVIDVHGRSAILLHKGNWQKDTRGCLLIVSSIGMKEGGCCGYHSTEALATLEALLPNYANHTLTVRNCQPYDQPGQTVRLTAHSRLDLDFGADGFASLTFTPMDRPKR